MPKQNDYQMEEAVERSLKHLEWAEMQQLPALSRDGIEHIRETLLMLQEKKEVEETADDADSDSQAHEHDKQHHLFGEVSISTVLSENLKIEIFDNRNAKTMTERGDGTLKLQRPCECGCSGWGLQGHLIFGKDRRGFNIKIEEPDTYDMLEKIIGTDDSEVVENLK
jgi:hypothetical protein